MNVVHQYTVDAIKAAPIPEEILQRRREMAASKEQETGEGQGHGSQPVNGAGPDRANLSTRILGLPYDPGLKEVEETSRFVVLIPTGQSVGSRM